MMLRILEGRTRIEEPIFGLSFITAMVLVQLPYEDINGNPVPTIIFHDQPSVFHAFVLAVNFAFTGAVITLCLREEFPKIARNCRRIAVLFSAAAAGILSWAIAPAAYNFVESLLC
ncbi:hypothetical protein BVC80_9011g56 [Macleaya cordata]|uniref:Uncharacterized protein n=1 Tax=Macleaya cordata TaxID=56857 RepID=A0A200QPZ9_MACCD|nr:hypothetical protein BVC80_9011g56 [Macleaya cordata]